MFFASTGEMPTPINGFEVAGCLETAAAIEAEINRLANALTEAQFHAPSRSGGWSPGYCIEHLVLVGRAFLPKWDAAMEAAAKTPDRAILPYGWWQRRVLSYTESPSIMKHKAPLSLVPCSRHSIGETVARFLSMHRELARRVVVSHELDVRRTKVQSPLFPWLSCALGFSFDLALAHERRHLSQAWRVHRQLTGS